VYVREIRQKQIEERNNMITKEMIREIAPNSKEEIISPLVGYLNEYMPDPKYQVNTWLRVCHFLAQAAHESASFRTLEEYASGSAYEGRKDLGNTQKGDGVRYKGRGIFQLTGRANYRQIGNLIGADLENNPELAETPKISVLTALEYWRSRNLNALADADDIMGITRKINGGTNGFDDRRRYLARCRLAIPKNIKFEVPPKPPVNPIVPPIVVAKKGDKSPYIADLQNMLIKKGAKITADGNFGPKSEQAVKDFQKNNGLTVTGTIDTDTLNKLMV
jgi:putative chitinase